MQAAKSDSGRQQQQRQHTLELFCCLLLAVSVRYCLSKWPHSGQSRPPLHGDYEAQRHWQEVTVQLAAGEWYSNSSANPLQHWGLDYPPLTAYHSCLLGHWMRWAHNASWVALGPSSWGTETPEHKLAMRHSVLLADLLLYLPPLLYMCRLYRLPVQLSLCALLQPGQLLVDHAHFQYNCVSLGLTLWSHLLLASASRPLLATCLFCLALNYKQMSLYHSLPLFAHLLGVCWRGRRPLLLAQLVACVLATFAIVWLPLPLPTWRLVLGRIFPIGRGLFEDYVASVWCPLNALLKLRTRLSQPAAAAMAAACTLAACLPALVATGRTQCRRQLLLASFTCSLAFFLLSYQVHEKSVLLPATSCLLLLPLFPQFSVSFLLMSCLSMWPLLADKDLLAVPTAACCLLFCCCCYRQLLLPAGRLRSFYLLLLSCQLLAIVASVLLPPPAALPHLHHLLVSSVSCAAFCCMWLLAHLCAFDCVQLD